MTSRKERQDKIRFTNEFVIGSVKSLRSIPTDFRDPVIVTVAARESVQFEYNQQVSPKERNKVLVPLVLLVPFGEPISYLKGRVLRENIPDI